MSEEKDARLKEIIMQQLLEVVRGILVPLLGDIIKEVKSDLLQRIETIERRLKMVEDRLSTSFEAAPAPERTPAQQVTANERPAPPSPMQEPRPVEFSVKESLSASSISVHRSIPSSGATPHRESGPVSIRDIHREVVDELKQLFRKAKQ